MTSLDFGPLCSLVNTSALTSYNVELRCGLVVAANGRLLGSSVRMP